MSTTTEVETWLATAWATRVPTEADPYGLSLIDRGPDRSWEHPVIQDHIAAILPGLLDAMDAHDRATRDAAIDTTILACDLLGYYSPESPASRLRSMAWYWIDYHNGIHDADDAAEALDYAQVRAIARDRRRLDAARQCAWSTILRCDDDALDRLAAPTPALLARLCGSEDPTLRRAAIDDPRCPPAARLAAALT